MTDMPARLQKLEEYWYDDVRVVLFEEADSGYWMAQIRGVFQDFEIKEIANALKAANRLKPL